MPAVNDQRRADASTSRSRAAKIQFSINALRTLMGVDVSHDAESSLEVFSGRLLKPGQFLIRAGELFDAFYVVNAGYLKTVFTDPGGDEQVLGFPTKGDLVGTDGFDQTHHVNDVVALSDAQVVVVPYEQLRTLSMRHPELLTDLLRVVSHQLVEEQLASTASAALGVEARVARFLLKISQQMDRQGYSSSCFNLRMRRQDMANYLGMKLETVSRTLSQLGRQALIEVRQREITVLDFNGLREMARQSSRQHHRRRSGVQNGAANGLRRQSSKVTPWSSLIDRPTDS